MAVELAWSKRADQSYARIVKYLEDEWTDKEVQNFVRETKHFFDLLNRIPAYWSHPRATKTYTEAPSTG